MVPENEQEDHWLIVRSRTQGGNIRQLEWSLETSALQGKFNTENVALQTWFFALPCIDLYWTTPYEVKCFFQLPQESLRVISYNIWMRDAKERVLKVTHFGSRALRLAYTLQRLYSDNIYLGPATKITVLINHEIMNYFQKKISVDLFQLTAEGLWVIELKLEPGTYEYKYLIINNDISINMYHHHEHHHHCHRHHHR